MQQEMFALTSMFHILSTLILISQLYILKELGESASCKYEYFSVILLNFFLQNLQGKALCIKQCFVIYASSLFILCKFSQVKLPWVYSHFPVASPSAGTHPLESGYKGLGTAAALQPKGPALHVDLQLQQQGVT